MKNELVDHFLTLEGSMPPREMTIDGMGWHHMRKGIECANLKGHSFKGTCADGGKVLSCPWKDGPVGMGEEHNTPSIIDNGKHGWTTMAVTHMGCACARKTKQRERLAPRQNENALGRLDTLPKERTSLMDYESTYPAPAMNPCVFPTHARKEEPHTVHPTILNAMVDNLVPFSW